MRHSKHRHVLGVKKEHRSALLANLSAALFKHGRITTTLAKAKALRPFSEKIITLAKKAAATEDTAKKVHYRRLAMAQVRDKDAVRELFDTRAGEFVSRTGGYTRIYKLVPRLGDAADMAIIELIAGSDEGYKKKTRKGAAKKSTRKATAKVAKKDEADTEVAAEVAEPEAEVTEVVPEETAPEAKKTVESTDADIKEAGEPDAADEKKA